jgi:hypothetical protein
MHNELGGRSARKTLFAKLRPYELDHVEKEIRELDLDLRLEVADWFRTDPEVDLPEHWTWEQVEAFYSLRDRKEMIEGSNGVSPPLGRLIRVPIKKPVSPGQSVRKRIIAEVAAEASERFGREITRSAVEQAWKRYRKNLVSD